MYARQHDSRIQDLPPRPTHHTQILHLGTKSSNLLPFNVVLFVSRGISRSRGLAFALASRCTRVVLRNIHLVRQIIELCKALLGDLADSRILLPCSASLDLLTLLLKDGALERGLAALLLCARMERVSRPREGWMYARRNSRRKVSAMSRSVFSGLRRHQSACQRGIKAVGSVSWIAELTGWTMDQPSLPPPRAQ